MNKNIIKYFYFILLYHVIHLFYFTFSPCDLSLLDKWTNFLSLVKHKQ